MSCKFPIVQDTLTGKMMKAHEGKIYYRWNDFEGTSSKAVVTDERYRLIPCGKCTECRLAYSREWANRCVLESLQHSSNWFITLTYNPVEIPTLRLDTGEIYRGGIQEVQDGKVLVANTLFHDDVQKFLKRLRRTLEYNNEPEIRYYMCGEYGSTTQRPHYHIIIFNLSIPDIEFYKLNQLHQPYFTSQWLEKLWGHGFITLGEVNWDTCAYVARYIMKKVKGPNAKEYYKSIGKTPEYTKMSLKPGIGANYYKLNKEQIYELDKIILPGKKTKIIQPPKYYDKLYDIDNPEKMQSIKQAREQKARLAQQLKMSKTTNELWTQLKLEHEAKQDAYKKLIRPLE